MTWKWYLNGLFLLYKAHKTINNIDYTFQVSFKPRLLQWYMIVFDTDNPNLILLNLGPFAGRDAAMEHAETITEIISGPQ